MEVCRIAEEGCLAALSRVASDGVLKTAGQLRGRRAGNVRFRVRQFVVHAGIVSNRRKKEGRIECVGRAASSLLRGAEVVAHRMR